jgi:branched-chain amino acid transport system ATP-binding protein
MLEVADLRANYGRIPILNGITFGVGAGEVVGVLGHNGMGKTTLMKTIMGHVPAVAGRIAFGGLDITRASTYARARAGLGYVPQGRDIFPQLTVAENLAIATPDRATIDGVVADFPILKPLLGRPGGALSGGEQQILALARCFCTRPKLILLDEPTEGIQPSIVEQIAEILSRLNARAGIALVVVEQNLDFVAGLAGRVLIIQKGAIVRAAKPEELRGAALLDEFTGVGA